MLTRETVKLLQDGINAAIQEVAKTHGVSLKVGNASFSQSTGTIKVEVGAISEAGVVTKEVEAFLLYANLLGVKKEALGESFLFNGKIMKFLGYMPRSTKFPFLAEFEGKQYKLPVYFQKTLQTF